MRLADRLADAARRDVDGLRFDAFMEAVLYDPEAGYFARSADRAGRSGDFLTAPETSADFAACVAQHLLEASAGTRGPWDLVEVGAGQGTLAAALLDALEGTPLADRLRLHLVERADAPRARAARRLADAVAAGRAALYASADDLPAHLGDGALVANELFDNLPVRRVMQTDRLMEIRLRHRRGRWEEHLVEAPPELGAYFADQGVHLRAGQTAEACLEAPRLVERLVDRFDACHILFIDYGDTAERLYDQERHPNGTLACHRRHGTDRAYTQDLGEKDLTAHVNFTPIAQTLARRGFTVDRLTTQAEFLLRNGLAERVAAGGEEAGDPLARMQRLLRAQQLFHPDAMGEAFRVLAARRDRRPDGAPVAAGQG